VTVATLLPAVVALPLGGFLLLALLPLSGVRLPARAAGAVGTGAVGAAGVAAAALAARFLAAPPPPGGWTVPLWTWARAGGFSSSLALRLDALSLVLVLVVTGVGFLIHLYAVAYMAEEEGVTRFFAAMNLFVASMLALVLAADLVLLFVGWEGVGLCSYLLIGFWDREPANGRAARKAFVVTRIGDTFLALGLLLIADRLGTLEIAAAASRAQELWAPGSTLAVAAAALLLAGAVGKSAQLPLQTWLPDAMAGPTPVSALLHAATMVTAGVYLVARTHAFFTLAPAVMAAVAAVGAATLLLAAGAALAQRDIKRVLAYSTMSQVGYMFLALGVGAWSAALFHLVTHAFFKALLFLAAGVVVRALDEERDIFRMGGLRRQLPLAWWSMLAGGASLSALPLVTAGFYSKDEILASAWASGPAGGALWLAGAAGAFLTSLYTFRMILRVFTGPPVREVTRRPGTAETVPLLVLGALALGAGALQLGGPGSSGPFLRGLLETALPPFVPDAARAGLGGTLRLLAAALSLGGAYLAARLFVARGGRELRTGRAGALATAAAAGGWGFDRLYRALLVAPFLSLARRLAGDPLDLVPDGVVFFARGAAAALSRAQSGRVRRYAAAVGIGVALFLALALVTR